MRERVIATVNFHRLADNTYPGRGIVIGRSLDGTHMVQVYWIMGRSENSRNRVLVQEGARLFTEAADAAKITNPSLTIYNAMDETHGMFFVTNGHQTDTLMAAVRHNMSFSWALEKFKYEPDAPNYTPRISGFCRSTGGDGLHICLSILRKNPWDESCDRSSYEYSQVAPGFGFCLTTYQGDDDPLPPFCGDPLLMPLWYSANETAERYWAALDEDNRVSLAVRFISLVSGESSWCIINKYTKVGIGSEVG